LVDLIKPFNSEIKAIKSKFEMYKHDENWKQGGSIDSTYSWISGYKKVTKILKESLTTNEMKEEEERRSRIPLEIQNKIEEIYSKLDEKLKEECYMCG